ncbi:MAG: class I SAM-dependent methyltransferase [Candidatus Bathyarchaeota archaeon]|jgi:predicted O-methyltransferase YrrM
MPWYGSHPYLNEYIREGNCRRIMEIGVYDGENALTMVGAAAQNFPPEEVEYYGFDLFPYHSPTEIKRKLAETGCRFTLYEGNSIETLAEAVTSLPEMDLIFIDGGKSYSVAVSDWENCTQLIHEGTGVFVHNADFPGVRRMVEGIPLDEYEVRIFHAPSEGSVAQIQKKRNERDGS